MQCFVWHPAPSLASEAMRISVIPLGIFSLVLIVYRVERWRNFDGPSSNECRLLRATTLPNMAAVGYLQALSSSRCTGTNVFTVVFKYEFILAAHEILLFHCGQ
jgi:hypothetical protein